MLLINGNKVSQVVCLRCFKRWISVRPTDVMLVDLTCPECGLQGDVIETGEVSTAEDLLTRVSEQEKERTEA